MPDTGTTPNFWMRFYSRDAPDAQASRRRQSEPLKGQAGRPAAPWAIFAPAWHCAPHGPQGVDAGGRMSSMVKINANALKRGQETPNSRDQDLESE